MRDIRAKFDIRNSPQSSDIGQNSDEGISDFRISGQSLIKRNCHNSRNIDDIDMKLGLVTKLEKNKTTSKKFDDDFNVNSLPFFQFTANLEQFGSRIPDAESVKFIFSLIVTFYLKKLKTELKNL